MKAVIDLSAKRPVLPEFPPCGISILESRHGEGFEMPPSRYDFSEIMLILEGKGWFASGKTRQPVGKGNLILVPARESYCFEDNPQAPLAMLCLCIRPPREQRALFEPVLPAHLCVSRNFGLSREVAAHLRAILYEQSQVRHGSAAVVVAQTLLILSKIARRQSVGNQDGERDAASSREIELLVRVRDYVSKLEGAFHESETIESAASRLGMSSRSLTHHFRAVTGVSRLQYIQELRLRQARHLLAQSRESITSIAFACGFEDLSNFFRAFRAREKLSPSQWREMHAEKAGSGGS